MVVAYQCCLQCVGRFKSYFTGGYDGTLAGCIG